MFALGIVDKLTPGNLTGGRFVAGTGEIATDGDGRADRRHPAEDGRARGRRARPCSSPRPPTARTRSGAVPAGLRLIKVRSLAGAMSALHALKRRPVPAVSRPAEPQYWLAAATTARTDRRAGRMAMIAVELAAA